METLFIFLLVICSFLFIDNKGKKRRKRKKLNDRKKSTNNASLLASITIALEKKNFKKAEKILNDLIASYLPDKSKAVKIAVRKKVAFYVSSGLRPESLSKALAKEFDIPAELAASIAEHGSRFLKAKYDQYRAADIGVKKYKWGYKDFGTKGCQHAFLNGRIFEISNPPLIDDAGNRAHPGESSSCRCMALYIIE